MKNKIIEIKKKAFKLSTDHQDGQAWLPLKDALDLFDEIQFEQPAVSEGEISVDVWDWVVTKGGKVVQITNDDMSELPYEEIERKATTRDVVEHFQSLNAQGEGVSVEDVKHTIELLQSKHDAFLGTEGEASRQAFKDGLSWAIGSIEMILPPQEKGGEE